MTFASPLFARTIWPLYPRGVEASPSTPPEHAELLSLPPSLENIDAKLNHLIVRTELGIRASERAEKSADRARELAEQGRDAARRSGSIAVKVVQDAALGAPAPQRLMAITVGAIIGGAAMSFVLQMAVALAGAATLASCLGR